MKKTMHKTDGLGITKCGLVWGAFGTVASGLWKRVTCRQCLNKRNVRLAKNKYCSYCNREY